MACSPLSRSATKAALRAAGGSEGLTLASASERRRAATDTVRVFFGLLALDLAADADGLRLVVLFVAMLVNLEFLV